MLVVIADGCASLSLKTLSITDISVDVVSMPQNALQSLTTMPAAITSDPLLTVPAYKTQVNNFINTQDNLTLYCYGQKHGYRILNGAHL